MSLWLRGYQSWRLKSLRNGKKPSWELSIIPLDLLFKMHILSRLAE
jgi:hypothetical protein